MIIHVPEGPRPAEPEIPICARCHEGTGWEYDAVEGLLSACCAASPMPVDIEPLEDWNA